MYIITELLSNLFLSLDLTRIIAESRNYHELYWAWDGWRDEVGGPAREDYKEYVRLKNKAAVANGNIHWIINAIYQSFTGVITIKEK